MEAVKADGSQVEAAQDMQITIVRTRMKAFGDLKLHNTARPALTEAFLVGVLRIQKWGRVLVLAASRECSTCDTQKVNPLPNS